HVHAGAGSRTARAGADQHAGHGAGMGLRGLRTLAGRLPLDFPAPCDAFSAGPKITSHRLALHTGAAMIDIRKKLQDELHAIDYELRIELPKEILKAREHGDLRENAEYKSAKERQAFLEGKKAQLQKRLAQLSLVNLDKIPHDRVAYGSRVVLYDPAADKEIEYRLVSPEESDMSQGLISITSPIGKALLGKEEGDYVEITTPGGKKEFELRRLVTIHDFEQ